MLYDVNKLCLICLFYLYVYFLLYWDFKFIYFVYILKGFGCKLELINFIVIGFI